MSETPEPPVLIPLRNLGSAPLRIDDSTTSVLPAGLPVAEDGGNPTYLLPFSDFDGHRGHTGAFCA